MRKYILAGILIGLIPLLIASNFELRSGSFFQDIGTAIRLLTGRNLIIEDNLTVNGISTVDFLVVQDILQTDLRINLYGGMYFGVNSADTESNWKAFSPPLAQMIFYDTTNKAVIQSTGTAAGQFGLITDGTQKPTGW